MTLAEPGEAVGVIAAQSMGSLTAFRAAFKSNGKKELKEIGHLKDLGYIINIINIHIYIYIYICYIYLYIHMFTVGIQTWGVGVGLHCLFIERRLADGVRNLLHRDTEQQRNSPSHPSFVLRRFHLSYFHT